MLTARTHTTAPTQAFHDFMKQEPAISGNQPETITVESRFGEVVVNLAHALSFPHGLLGLPQFKGYALAEMPNPKLAGFKLLQSLEDADLSFAVLPLPVENTLIDKADITECSTASGVAQEDMALLIIVSVHKQPAGGVRITGNLRAPVVVDTKRRLAMQYVFPNSKYQIAYELS